MINFKRKRLDLEIFRVDNIGLYANLYVNKNGLCVNQKLLLYVEKIGYSRTLQ